MEQNTLLNSHQGKLHHLAQFVAAFGASYLVPQEDHSEQSMSWNIAESALQSQKVDNTRISLEYPQLMLYIIHDNERHAFDPLGAARGDIESWVRETLSSIGMDPGKYSLDLGFTISTPEDSFISLDTDDEKILLQLTEERNIAQKALEAIKTNSEMASSEIAVWPHHFDTGMLLYKNEKKDQGYSLGYAPADEVSDVPYFYASHWPEDLLTNKEMPALKHGFWHRESWKGAKIPVDRALDLQVITRFYREYISVMNNIT
ncbi:hypothetical protein E7Z59_00985 [Robertkochia marina]|uniref:Uncharacterized protein n=1 Tax=Robertkochia marina TaxID=1227945 RepID=A0A4S3M451_9FLAO|nr:hypothetical protein [Robertkochia marina]THD68937.1 hypothetical protein E7Z59_00985 [Robertkochia marina]TRZ44758.1 hypothetical protein D3A96_06940 [Robertkochia marina]